MQDEMNKTDDFVRRQSLNSPLPTRRQAGTGKGTSVALWSAQVFLAALFMFAGVMKFVMPREELVKQSSLPAWFLLFIGVAEILGSIGMILPALLRVWPKLTPIAGCGLVIIMAGATVISLPMGAVALIPFVAGVLAVFVVYGRWRLRPIRARA
jgi:uncharacterized membrane protein YphA (DoxX/SURF4 family)